MLPIFKSIGISFRHPCPHTHKQNGKVERKHRHVVETGLTLLAQASLHLKYWWHVFTSAVFLINCLPTPILNNISPFEVLYKRKPYYSQFRAFGCTCFPHRRPYNRHKLMYKSDKCVFLGYSPSYKGYKCLHPSGRLYIAHNVLFDESEFPYSILFLSKSNSTHTGTLQSHDSTGTWFIPVWPYSPVTSSPQFTPHATDQRCSQPAQSLSSPSQSCPMSVQPCSSAPVIAVDQSGHPVSAKPIQFCGPMPVTVLTTNSLACEPVPAPSTDI